MDINELNAVTLATLRNAKVNTQNIREKMDSKYDRSELDGHFVHYFYGIMDVYKNLAEWCAKQK